ncbi:MAG: cobalamin biosynthesis protein [Pseudomonadota bacterium]
MIAASLMLLAWAIEILMGWPNRLFRIVRHPVVWMGGLISLLDRQLNRERFGAAMRYALGTVSSLVVLGLVTAIALGISRALPATWWGLGIEALIASSLLASRSLYTHVKAVAVPLLANNISSARQAVSPRRARAGLLDWRHR